ncbi:hypothetical protein Tco_0515505 [Tanacetum coccineum]
MLTTRQGATIVDIEQLIAQRVADAMATLEANWNNGNGIPHEEVSEELCTPPVVMESMFHISNCATNCQVKLAAYALLDSALTCWNTHTKTGTDVVGYIHRFQELALLCLGMVLDEEKKIERYVLQLQGKLKTREGGRVPNGTSMCNNHHPRDKT